MKGIIRKILREEIEGDFDSRFDNIEDEGESLEDRVDYIEANFDPSFEDDAYREQLTSEILNYLLVLTDELEDENGLNLSDSQIMMNKMMSRGGRKSYYMSKWRL